MFACPFESQLGLKSLQKIGRLRRPQHFFWVLTIWIISPPKIADFLFLSPSWYSKLTHPGQIPGKHRFLLSLGFESQLGLKNRLKKHC